MRVTRVTKSGILLVGGVTGGLLACRIQYVHSQGFQEPTVPSPSGGKVVNGVQLVAQAKTQRVEPCNPIMLDIIVKNTGKENVNYFNSGPENDFIVTVKNDKDETMPLTRFGTRDHSTHFGTTVDTVQSGQQRVYKLPVNRLVDMTQDGTYYATVRRRFIDSNPGGPVITGSKPPGEVESNSVRIAVYGAPADKGAGTAPGGLSE